MKAIIANNLTKIYPDSSAKKGSNITELPGKKAVDDVSFELNQGEIFGFLGPNGAGKTTVVKLLNGILTPTAGNSTVLGIDPHENPVELHQIAGVLTEHAQMYNNLTGLQNLIFYGNAFGISLDNSTARVQELLETLELGYAKDRKLETYSTGMRQRLSLARAMMHRPKILFLDEPTSGLDPESILSVNNMIKSLAENEGATVFLCTHQLRYAQELCSSYGLISNGVLLASGSLEELRSLVFSGFTVNIKADKIPESISTVKVSENNYELNVETEEEIPHIVKRIVDDKGSVYSVTTHRLSLEEIYFALFEKQKCETGDGPSKEVSQDD